MPLSKWRSHVRFARVVVCLGIAFFAAGARQTVRSASVLVSHWKLDEGQGTTTTDSAGAGTGTLRNGATWTTRFLGGAVSLDGVDDYISLPALEVAGSEITLTAWVRNTGTPNGLPQPFVAKEGAEGGTYWLLGIDETGSGSARLRFSLRAATISTLVASSGNLPLNTWYHAAATYDGASMRLYLNGTLVGSMAASGSIAPGRTIPVNIGRSPEASSYLQGAIDDVRIYGSALTPTEIAALVATGTPVNQRPAVSLDSPAQGATFPASSDVTMSATASDADGTVERVEFFAGSRRIGTDYSSPYSVTWSYMESGVYTLKAIAYDDAGASTTSASRTVTATSNAPVPAPPPNQPPLVSLAAPVSGATFTALESITLSATASDPDGTIAQVEFYANNTLIATDTTDPYTFAWAGVVAGSYAVTAVARDNLGATTVSSTSDITVTPPNLPSTAVFVPSSNHATVVDRYVLEIFPAGADPTVANPVATLDLGKPAIINGECSANISPVIFALPPGRYIATVTAMGTGGTAQSAPSSEFSR